MARSAAPSPLLTADDVERLSIPDKQVELVRGRLVVREPPGSWHGAIASRLGHYLSAFALPRELGIIFAQDTGFKIARDPDTVRAPDAAFVAMARADRIPRRGYAELAPDLVAEVLSPDDAAADVLAKLADWLAAGTRLVWVIDPHRSEIRVYRIDGSLSILTMDDALDGEDVLPGFTCPVNQLFG